MEKYKNIFIKIFELNDKEREFVEKMEYGNSDKWDSLNHMKLLSEVENAFDISMQIEDLLAFKSYIKGIEILKKYNVALY